jgi:hypothetical protein
MPVLTSHNYLKIIKLKRIKSGNIHRFEQKIHGYIAV